MSTPTPGDPVLAAWQSLLAAEHAAVFVYRECGPHLPSADRDLARSLEAAHAASRDQLSAAILASGQTPASPQADYDIGDAALSESVAVAACRSVEENEAQAARLLVLAAAGGSGSEPVVSAIPSASPTASATDLLTLRRDAQAILSAAAVRAQTWRRRADPSAAGVAFPGL